MFMLLAQACGAGSEALDWLRMDSEASRDTQIMTKRGENNWWHFTWSYCIVHSYDLFISLLCPPLSLLLFLMLSRPLLLPLLKMTCNLSQADKRMRRAIMRSSHKSAVIHILLLFSSPLISSLFFSSSLCYIPSFGFDSGRTEMKENRKTTQSTSNKVSSSLSYLVRCHFLSVCLSGLVFTFGGGHSQGSG